MILRAVGVRLGQAVLTVLGASLVLWSLLPLAPGDPARRVLLARGVSNPERVEIEAVRRELGVDRPLPVQYGWWLGRAVRGDLSTSYRSGEPVAAELGQRFPATARLAAAALLLSLLVAVPAGLAGAAYRGRWPDTAVRLGALIGASTPAFLAGLVVLEVVVGRLGWGVAISDGSLGQVGLPAACLALAVVPTWARLLRANLLDALGAGYPLVARARGAGEWRVLVRHALPNAALPFLTAVGVGAATLLGGAAVVETVFTWPGIGSYVVAAIGARDVPVVVGFAAVGTLVYVAASFAVDLTGLLLDPRRRVPR